MEFLPGISNTKKYPVKLAGAKLQAKTCPVKNKPLAEKTVEDVLQYFGKSLKEARRRYRQFVKNGIDQGKRPEFQGGGLVRPACHARSMGILKYENVEREYSTSKKQLGVKARAGRSAGGDKTGLLGQKEEDKELSDQRILGSGDFVAEVLIAANEFEEKRIKKSIPIDQLADKITSYFDIKIDDILIKSQKSKISKARSIICYLAIKEMKYSGTSVGKFLNIRRYSALRCAERGKNIFDKDKRLWDLL